jgi:hypothetical protein
VRSYRFKYQYLPSTPADDRSIAPAGQAANTPASQNTPGGPSFTQPFEEKMREGWEAKPPSSGSTSQPSAQATQP